ncbi:nuclear transport factor 2 family protein [Pedobacter psychrodurus]|nr:nuclear transport factor 2 family protein [Pedobacter psychrodurus]
MKNLIITLLLTGTALTASAQRAKKASLIFSEYLAAVSSGNPKAAASFFTEDGYMEAPYVAAFGMPAKFQGHDVIEATMAGLLKLAPNFHFTGMKVVSETPNQLVAEYESEATTATGRPYKMQYIGVITLKNGKIFSHKEYLNTVPFVEALFPNGLKDLIK